MTSWRRKLLTLGDRLGLRSADAGASAVVVSRHGRPEVDRLGDDVSVVSLHGRAGIQPVTDGVWLLQAPGAEPLALDALDDHGWLIQRRSGRRFAQRIGPPRVRAHLLHHRGAARANARELQNGLGTFAGNAHIAWMLRELDVNCVLDVGANVGQYARRLRAAGYTGRIVSFEPVGEMFARLSAAAEDDPEWRVVNAALGSEDGTATINAMEGSMSSLLDASEFGKSWSRKLSDMHAETISVRRLDGIYDDAVAGIDEPRVYLKLDTQGFDLEAFAGAGDRIKDVIGMQSEVACVPIYDGMPRWLEQLAVYEEAGYEVTGMFPVNIDRTSLRVIEFDAVMIRVEALGPR
jgi:FkbM family methyltransferase